MSTREFIRRAEREGWSFAKRRFGHLELRHPQATDVLIAPSSPSCPRAFKNAKAAMRRALPREPKPSPAEPKPKRLRKHPPARPPRRCFGQVARDQPAEAEPWFQTPGPPA
jgi:predicted RNA binding protein YcfA (HicA-like mRNA interferase family)